MIRLFVAGALVIASIYAAHAIGLGEGTRFGRLGAAGKKGTAAVIPSCASPTAPNGVVDLSQCSNAFYAATIF
jgi:hypothetical protein